MDTFLQDVRYGLRMLLKKPGFTVAAIIVLTLGIGANTAIFSVVNAVLLRPLPYKNSERLVWIWETNMPSDIPKEPASPPNFMDWKTQAESFDDMAGFVNVSLILTGEGEPERVAGYGVTQSFLSVLGIEPKLGRNFLPEEDKPDAYRTMILSDSLWKRRFGANPNIVGSSITANGSPYTVVGVMPPDFKQPSPDVRQEPQFWIALRLDYAKAHRRGDFLSVVARMKPGIQIEQARAEMGAITSRLAEAFPKTNTNWGVTMLSLHERFVGDVRPALLVLLGAVCFLLLIACANVANLLLARATSRQKEIAVRAALGAGRWRITRQLLTESLLLALAGGAMGLLLALWGIEILTSISPRNIPRLSEINLDSRVLFFTIGVSLVTGVVFGLLPALQAANPQLNEMLKEGGRGSSEGGRGGIMRNVLVVVEVASALILLIGAGLMVKSFLRLQNVNPGFNPTNTLTMQLLLPRTKYKEGPQVVAFYEQLLDRVRALPGVESVGAIDTLPLGGGGDILGFTIEGRPPLQPGDNTPDAETRAVTEDYFRTIGIPLMSGRLLTEADGPDAPQAVVINETMARRYFPGEDPLGRRINLGNPEKTPWMTIVGIVGDIHHEGLNVEPYSQMYTSHKQNPEQSLSLVVRTASDPKVLVPLIRSQVWEMDKDQPLYNVRTMEEILSASLARPRFNTTLIVIFAAVAMILAAVGIYGVISYSVTQRTHEIGIRMALGARPADVLRLVVGKGMVLTGIGVGIGLGAAFILTRVMESLLFGVSATDPLTFALIAVILTGVALAASFIPARRATKVDPMVALRYE